MKLREILSKVPTIQYLLAHPALDAEITGLKLTLILALPKDYLLGCPVREWMGAIKSKPMLLHLLGHE